MLAYDYPLLGVFWTIVIIAFWVLVIFGVFGYGLRKLAIDPSPLVVALVLGPLMEKSLRQALFLSNNRTVESILTSSGTNSLARLAALEDRARVKELFLRALSREPDREEMKRSLEFLSAREPAPFRMVVTAFGDNPARQAGGRMRQSCDLIRIE